jgi:transcriptional regulator with XRE-family HTH domain
MKHLNTERLQDQRIWDEYTHHRKALGITQTELAQSLGKSQGLVTHYETGRQGQREIFRRPLEGTIEMCIAIGFPTERFIPNLPTATSKVADCKNLYVALASNGIGQAVSSFGITSKEVDERLDELDSDGLYKHELFAQFSFRRKCIAYTIESAIKVKFKYKASVGEYLGVKPEVVVAYVRKEVLPPLDPDFTYIGKMP